MSKVSLSLIFLAITVLSACGSGGSGSTSSVPIKTAFPLGGQVSGLLPGDRITLSNGIDSVEISANGPFRFQSNTENGTKVQILKQPTSGLTCISATIADALAPTNGYYFSEANAYSVQISCGKYPAFVPSLPQVTTPTGAPAIVQPNPRIVPVYFSDSPNQVERTDFLRKLISSSLWLILREYGVGAAVLERDVYIGTPAPTFPSSTSLAAWVKSNALHWLPSADRNTFFVLHFPPSSINSPTLCGTGYHFSTLPSSESDAVQYAFAVVPGCGNIDQVVQHEVMEGVADPFMTGYLTLRTDDTLWQSVTGNPSASEIGDMCEWIAISAISGLPGYSLQPIYSNEAAMRGTNPCIPNASDTWFGAFVDLPDLVQAPSPIGKNHAIVLSPGSTATIPIKVFSGSPTGSPINISVTTSMWWGTNLNAASVKTQLEKSQARNGELVGLKITMPDLPASGIVFFYITAEVSGQTIKFPMAVSTSRSFF